MFRLVIYSYFCKEFFFLVEPLLNYSSYVGKLLQFYSPTKKKNQTKIAKKKKRYKLYRFYTIKISSRYLNINEYSFLLFIFLGT